ncbi:hypothetical protein NL676_034177 [Syzygium grande]|nr:hypothetical protein NL676_034177 [Syzygium grande]
MILLSKYRTTATQEQQKHRSPNLFTPKKNTRELSGFVAAANQLRNRAAKLELCRTGANRYPSVMGMISPVPLHQDPLPTMGNRGTEKVTVARLGCDLVSVGLGRADRRRKTPGLGP